MTDPTEATTVVIEIDLPRRVTFWSRETKVDLEAVTEKFARWLKRGSTVIFRVLPRGENEVDGVLVIDFTKVTSVRAKDAGQQIPVHDWGVILSDAVPVEV